MFFSSCSFGFILLVVLNLCKFYRFENIIPVDQSIISNEYLGDTKKHLFYFIQLTDLHLTHFGHRDRIEQLEQFCNDIIGRLIKPRVTLVTGDLINSANDNSKQAGRLFQAAQYEDEWRIYNDILNRTKVTKSTLWLDMRGNHDTFMDSNPDSNQSFYRIYSHQGRQHPASYQYTIKTDDGDSYSFISVDLCPRPGMARPFNLLAFLSQSEHDRLKKLSDETKNSTSIIYFGHYPIKFGYTNGLTNLMKNGLVYLNGHLHIGQDQFFKRHQDQLLEIHLGDWKSKRRFRLITIDSGLISFADYRFDQRIFGVISNPKAAKFKILREPLNRLKTGSHIRILIFSKKLIVKVEISIDGNLIGYGKPSKDNPNLFILPWNNKFYDDEKLHKILVEIQDEENEKLILNHEFCLSAKALDSTYSSEIFLSLNWPIFTLIISLILTFSLILILFFHRLLRKRRSNRCLNRRLRILCSVNNMYYSLFVLLIYQLVGPLYFGYLSEEHFGIIFFWGFILKKFYLPPDAQLSIVSSQFYLFIIPLIYTLSWSCSHRYEELRWKQNFQNESRVHSRYSICLKHFLFLLTMFIGLVSSFAIMISYRFSWLFSPFGSILLIFSFYLYIKSRRLKLKDFQLNSFVEANTNKIDNDCNFTLEHTHQQTSLLEAKSN